MAQLSIYTLSVFSVGLLVGFGVREWISQYRRRHANDRPRL